MFTQYILEVDGSVYPFDFYYLVEYRMGDIQENTLRECSQALRLTDLEPVVRPY